MISPSSFFDAPPQRRFYRALREASSSSFWAHCIAEWLRGNGWPKLPQDAFWVGGFPRSGNTFTGGLLSACMPDVIIATHGHRVGMVRGLVSSGLPGLCVVREPLGCCISLAIFGDSPLYRPLQDYVDFYTALKRVAPRPVLLRFEDVTSHPEQAVLAIAKRFGMPFKIPQVEDLQGLVFKFVEDLYRTADGSVSESRVARPSSYRRERSQALQQTIANSPALQELLNEARAAYANVVSESDSLVRVEIEGVRENK